MHACISLTKKIVLSWFDIQSRLGSCLPVKKKYARGRLSAGRKKYIGEGGGCLLIKMIMMIIIIITRGVDAMGICVPYG